MKFPRHALCMAVATMICVPLSYGQKVPPPKQGDWPVVEFIQLTHMGAQDMANVIRGLGFGVVVVAAPDGKILLRGQKPEVARAVEVIGKLDTPGAADAAGVRAEFIPIDNIDTTYLGNVVKSLITGSQSKFAVDYSNRMLIVRASEDELTAIRTLVSQMARPERSVTVDFFFLRAMIGSAGADRDRKLPSALAPIAETLAANGFTDISLIAPIRVTCRMRRDFRSNSRLRTNPTKENKLGDNLDFTVRGKVGPAATEDTVELEVYAGINGRFINADLKEVGRIDFSVEATITAKLGQYVILSAAPSSTAKGEAVAVVVRVTSDSAQ